MIGSPQTLTLRCGRQVPLVFKKGGKASKRATLRVSEQGVVLRVPPHFPIWSAQRFLEQNLPWVEAQVARIPSLGLPLYSAADTWTVPLAGHVVPVVWHEAAVARTQVVGSDDEVHAWAPAGATDAARRALVFSALQTRLRSDVAQLLARWLPTIPGGRVSRVCLASTRSQWGSMTATGRLSLANSLVGVRPSALEYVVIHELCHLLHANHSPTFWREVGQRFPAYQAEHDYLARVALKLHALMGRLG